MASSRTATSRSLPSNTPENHKDIKDALSRISGTGSRGSPKATAVAEPSASEDRRLTKMNPYFRSAADTPNHGSLPSRQTTNAHGWVGESTNRRAVLCNDVPSSFAVLHVAPNPDPHRRDTS